MAELPENPTPIQVECHFRNLLWEEGMQQPDQIRYEVDPKRIVFLWHDRKVAIEIEVGPAGPVDVRSATAPV